VEVVQNVRAHEPELRETVEGTPTPIVAAADREATDDSGKVLPLHRWVQTATQSARESAADWPHALLTNRDKLPTASFS
jgi:hypothetical protein